MANQYAVAPVSAHQVGSYFVQQYYQVLQQQPDCVHRFYNESSSMIRVDGETSDSASNMVQIHNALTSLNFTGIEIKTINSLESWNGGVLVVVSGSVNSKDFNMRRKFVQTFFLAPQEKGYFVLNDMFHFADDEVAHQPYLAAAKEQHVDYQPAISTHIPDPSVSDYSLDEETREYDTPAHVQGDEPVHEYIYEEHHQHAPEPEAELEPEHEPDRLEDETTFDEPSPLLQSTVTTVQEPQVFVEEPIGEPEKMSYASILRAKGKSPPSVSSRPAFTQRPPAADRNHVSQPLQQKSTPNIPKSGVDAREQAISVQEGESKSVYVRNLPSTVTSLEILQEFKNFGKIKQDGVFLRNRMDTGVCYAFVEFEDVQCARNAIEASPIELAGRKVYIEERRANGGPSRHGRSGGGRGRGGRGGRTTGLGSEQNGSDGRRLGTNGRFM